MCGRWIGLAGIVLVLAGCTGTVSDTGHTGRWRRPDTEFEISIARNGAAWLFCQSGGTLGMREQVECVDGQRSIVRRGQDIAYDYEFETTFDEKREALRVEIRGIPRTSGDTEFRSLEEFRLGADGRSLWRWTLAVNGERRFPPASPLRYDKVSDRPL